MAPLMRIFYVFLVIYFLSPCNLCMSSRLDPFEAGYPLKVTFPIFKNSVKSSMSVVQNATSTMTSYVVHAFEDSQLSNAISVCLELLDVSHKVLDRSLSIVEDPKAKDHGTGDLRFDLQTWLSAVHTNIATCNDELVGTNSTNIVKDKILMNLNHVAARVLDQQKMVKQIPSGKRHGFPYWLESNDLKVLLQANEISPNITVAIDGSGDFKNIMDAINAAPVQSPQRFVIYIKKGTYREYVNIEEDKWNIMMVGDGMDQTIISGDRSNATGWKTFKSATFGVMGQKFIAVNMTFENTAGPKEGQAVALRSNSDQSVFFRCGIRGYQDTLYAFSNRQFYRECQIRGTVDFIFGDAIAVFQKCDILPRQASKGQSNTITAQGRKEPNMPTGFSFHLCNISGDSDLISAANPTPTYLGRPWRQYSRTVFIECFMSNIVRPEGWLRWNQTFESTLFYAEYNNRGPGAGTNNRVKWPGVHVLDSSVAKSFTVSEFIGGDAWLPLTGVPYTGGLGSG